VLGADRVERWVAGFEVRHGVSRVAEWRGEAVRIEAADGASVVLHVSYPPLPGAADAEPALAARLVAENASAARDLGVLLIRRAVVMRWRC